MVNAHLVGCGQHLENIVIFVFVKINKSINKVFMIKMHQNTNLTQV